MYNIYINERLLKICLDKDSLSGAELVFRLSGEEPEQFVKELVYSFEKQPQVQSMTLATHDIDKTWRIFKKSYTMIEAAGGLVFNDAKLLLMIYRNNRWDLPKGKIEGHEEPDEAALREVTEECGIHHLNVKKQLSITYHTYVLNKERILKRTYWFKMTTSETNLTPQNNEGITEARWMTRSEVKKASIQTYAGISALLVQHGLV